jgi:hypothetical protein
MSLIRTTTVIRSIDCTVFTVNRVIIFFLGERTVESLCIESILSNLKNLFRNCCISSFNDQSSGPPVQ